MTHLEGWGQLRDIAAEWFPKWKKVGEKKDYNTKLMVYRMVEVITVLCTCAGDDDNKQELVGWGIHLIELAEELVSKNILPENTYLIICRSVAELVN